MTSWFISQGITTEQNQLDLLGVIFKLYKKDVVQVNRTHESQGNIFSPSMQSWKRPTGAILSRPSTVLSSVHLSVSDN